MNRPRAARDSALSGLAEALDRYVPNALRATHTPGVTVAVASGAGLVYSGAFGFADLARSTPMRRDHVMPGGSLTKFSLAVAVMQLVERGVLDLHRPLPAYTDLAAVNPFGYTPITAYHLATHTSGLSTDTYDASLGLPPPLAEHIRSGFLSARAREYGGVGARWSGAAGTYRYCNFGAAVLGHVVALLNPAGHSFSDYTAQRIFEPLGLASTTIPADHSVRSVPDSIAHRRATGYGRFGTWCVPTPTLHSAAYPSTGVLTTADDYAVLLAALLLPEHPAYGTLLGDRMVRSMVSRHVTGNQESTPVDVGVLLNMGNLDDPDTWIGGGGQYPWGWCAQAQAFPHHGIVVVVLSNVWDLTRYINPSPRTAPGLITRFVTRWMRDDPACRASPLADWSEQSAYAAGLVMAERVSGLLNAEGGPLSSETITAMATEARNLATVSHEDTWDAATFAQGAIDAIGAGNDLGSIRRLLDSCEVSHADLDLHALSWGASAARMPVPMAHWAERRGEDDPSARHVDTYTPRPQYRGAGCAGPDV
ncbi:hypothetical protein SALBM311S_08211 [Streptomyces alboniger]